MATTSYQMSSSGLLSCSAPRNGVTLDGKRLFAYKLSNTSDLSIDETGKKISEQVRPANRLGIDQIEQALCAGYISDDESSDNEEPQDSGRTRSSTRRAKHIKEQEVASTRVTSDKASSSKEGKGKKRKKTGPGGGGSDSDPDDSQSKRRPCDEPVVSQSDELVCLCPKDVMTCIGILPSHPIISYFKDSDDSDSSCNDDLTHTVLPTVARNRPERGEGC